MRALVTGSSRGIGAAIVKRLTLDGYKIDTPSRLELDLSNLQSVQDFSDSYQSDELDLLVLNAGENFPLNLSDISTDHWLQTMNVNLNSAFMLIRDVGTEMAKNKRGRIVVISSCYSYRSRGGRAPYSASKAALNSLVQSAAIEFAEHGVLVNGVAPGFVLTDLTYQNNNEDGLKQLASRIPLGRLASPNEIADVVAFIGSTENTYITGQVIAVDGGFLCQ
jgi:3-oxoacyl-[acyl-carrier protein] reductase